MRRLAILALGSCLVACSFPGAGPPGDGDSDGDAGSGDAELPTARCGTPGALRSRFEPGDETLFRRIESTRSIVFAGDLALRAPDTGDLDDIASDYAVDIVGHAVGIEVTEPVVGTGDAQFFATVGDDRFGFVLTSSTIHGLINDSPGVAQTFSLSAHRFLRIREEAGTIYLEAAGSNKVFQPLQSRVLAVSAPVLVGFDVRSSDGQVDVSFDNLNTDAELAIWCLPEFSDDFEDALLDPHWIRINEGRCDSLIETQGSARFDQVGGTSPTRCVNRTAPGYRIIGSSVAMHAPTITPPSGPSTRWRVALKVSSPDGAMARLSYVDGELCTIAVTATNTSGTADTCIDYVTGDHDHWRLSMTSESRIVFETSEDGTIWAPLGSVDATFDGQLVKIEIGTTSDYLKNDKPFSVRSFN